MSRYIDADKLIVDMRHDFNTFPSAPQFGTISSQYGVTMKQIENAPSIDLADYVPKDFHDKTCEAMAKRHQEEIADMVSVVRCKECKWCFYVQSDDVYACIKKGQEHKMYNPSNHFCSYGEREGE